MSKTNWAEIISTTLRHRGVDCTRVIPMADGLCIEAEAAGKTARIQVRDLEEFHNTEDQFLNLLQARIEVLEDTLGHREYPHLETADEDNDRHS